MALKKYILVAIVKYRIWRKFLYIWTKEKYRMDKDICCKHFAFHSHSPLRNICYLFQSLH